MRATSSIVKIDSGTIGKRMVRRNRIAGTSLAAVADCLIAFGDGLAGVWRRVFVSPKTLLGRKRQEVGAPGVEPEALKQHLCDLDERRPHQEFAHPRTNNRGETVFVLISGKPVFDDSGKFAGYSGIGRNI